MGRDLKIIVCVIVALALGVAGFIGFAVLDRGGDETGSHAGVVDGRQVATISHGKAVDLKRHLEPGVLTAIDFYADW